MADDRVLRQCVRAFRGRGAHGLGGLVHPGDRDPEGGRRLFAELARTAPIGAQSLTVAAFALLGAGGIWTAAVLEMSAVLAAMLWGFGLWWIAVAAMIARHARRSAFTDTAADWAYVFPPAAMVLATLVLGRFWKATPVEILGVALSVILVAVWATVATRSVRILSRGR